MNWISKLERDGYAILQDIVPFRDVKILVRAIASFEASTDKPARGLYAIRNLMDELPIVRELANSAPIRNLVEPVLGKKAFTVRSLFFDKTLDANWKVAWHQDLSIAVKEQMEVEGFGPWSMKAGVLHVQPPASVLEQMLTVRVHLDDCDLDNGPLQVLPGSHGSGRLDAEAIANWRQRGTAIPCTVPSGGVVLMRPLILHSSSPATKPAHRRVIHLEFSASLLPNGLKWAFPEQS
jgi:ectoine hydroxylase-related dioxygenase (phytanoyl-CoA dioxygenase family)